jgi:hypothetical protein
MNSMLEDRYAADVFGLTYREFSEAKTTHYKWRLIVPEAVKNLQRAQSEQWSLEKLADYLDTSVEEARQSLRRYVMSEQVNKGQTGPERIARLFQEWLERFEPDVHERKSLARDLSRLLSSQLEVAAQSGESLETLIQGLEKTRIPGDLGNAGNEKAAWGPGWKD